MNSPTSIPRYNQPIPHMRMRTSSGLRIGWLTSFFIATIFIPSSLCASNLADGARQLAHKIAAATGPGTFALEIANHSSLDERSAREVRSALDAQLDAEGVHTSTAEQAMGTVEVNLSESLREYVWTAVIEVGADEKKVALISLPRAAMGAAIAAALPIVLKTTMLYAQAQPMLDAAQIDVPGGSRLLVLTDDSVAIYRHQGANPAGRWELDTSLPIVHSHSFPRDLRGRLLLRRDHWFDVYLPGTFCRSSANAVAPIALTCDDGGASGAASSGGTLSRDNSWPLTPEDAGPRAIFAGGRNFFTGSISPGIGKISEVPSFYSAAPLPRSGYTLWALAAVDGSLHLVDGMRDQVIRGANWGSDIAAIHSSCGTGTQLLATESGTAEGDGIRAFEVPDRDPVAASSTLEFDGKIVALWPDTSAAAATAIVKRKDTGWYEADRISISCGN